MSTPLLLLGFGMACWALALWAEKRSARRRRHEQIVMRVLSFKRPEGK